MRSIFSKILFWAIGTTIVSLIGFAMTTRLVWGSFPGPVDFLSRTLELEVEGAREALEEGGPQQLQRYLARIDRLFDAKHILIDLQGRDALNGEDRSRLLEGAGLFPTRPRSRSEVLAVVTRPSKGYRLLIILPRRNDPVGMLPYYLWIFLMIAALGYALAVYLGKPLRSLRNAVERFGQGDLTSRVGSTRRDEIGELARAFDRMAERTETLMNAQKRLLQDVSHELRSPLSRLKLTVRLAKTQNLRPDSLDRIKKEVDRLSTLVDELLRVTAAEDDPAASDREEIALDELLKSVVDVETIEAEAKACKLQLTVVEPATVIGDRELLGRALENVIRNATRHSPENGIVEISLTSLNDEATITIRDFGEGVPEESLQSIFEPFYRVGPDRSRAGGGVGLGLSITRRAIELNGGSIEASNAAPGLKVVIRLPRFTTESPTEFRNPTNSSAERKLDSFRA